MIIVYQDGNNVVLDENIVVRKTCINGESNSLELPILLYNCHDINMKFLVVLTSKYIYQDRFNEIGNRACNNGKNNNEHKIYESMAQISSDDERKSGKYGDSSQQSNWILDSGAKCHMTPEVSDFIPGSLEDTDKLTEVADGHHVTSKQKVQVQIKMDDDNGKTFIATL